mmetsp:Transcript_55320/g.135477  ORF Transcript_55320/g.135477 Transcript_55320/m.135477 type:complete len:304 (+) Transcript_55320:388-1299(+)
MRRPAATQHRPRRLRVRRAPPRGLPGSGILGTGARERVVRLHPRHVSRGRCTDLQVVGYLGGGDAGRQGASAPGGDIRLGRKRGQWAFDFYVLADLPPLRPRCFRALRPPPRVARAPRTPRAHLLLPRRARGCRRAWASEQGPACAPAGNNGPRLVMRLHLFRGRRVRGGGEAAARVGVCAQAPAPHLLYALRAAGAAVLEAHLRCHAVQRHSRLPGHVWRLPEGHALCQHHRGAPDPALLQHCCPFRRDRHRRYEVAHHPGLLQADQGGQRAVRRAVGAAPRRRIEPGPHRAPREGRAHAGP